MFESAMSAASHRAGWRKRMADTVGSNLAGLIELVFSKYSSISEMTAMRLSSVESA
jgi:hypothetical protein